MFIRSAIFTVGGHGWVVSFCPEMIDKEFDADWVLVSFMFMGTSEVRASFELKFVDQCTGVSFSVHKEAPMTFSPNCRSKTVLFKKRSVFESPNYLRDDCLTIECVVTVTNGRRLTEAKPLPRIEVPPPDIAKHFAKLLETEEGVDVTFSVGGVKFKAHKMVLATRTPVFRAEVYGPMREAGTKAIVIEDVQPDVFRAFLHFIYSDSLPPLDDLRVDDYGEMIRHLLVAADRYAMERLKTVATTLALADQHNCDKLKDACIEFMTNMMDAVVATQGYKNLKRTCPSVAFEALEKTSRIRKT
ncbi:hypothetical protein GQ55_6G072300 [Panicum hallii var. hallii]|uniref:BTB domain-containing protein n=1 Tax=Panicum hallii var. hallii TaxID=1504633 RepID=A0A2T7D510_9POAL|nr:hypothetical protein GQ55_6G072300 [Panicum hallii var. hallii]